MIITANGDWMVGPDYNDNWGGITSIQNGLDSPPTTGWYYYNGDEWTSDDPTLEFIRVLNFLGDGRPRTAKGGLEVEVNSSLPMDSSSTGIGRHQ